MPETKVCKLCDQNNCVVCVLKDPTKDPLICQTCKTNMDRDNYKADLNKNYWAKEGVCTECGPVCLNCGTDGNCISC